MNSLKGTNSFIKKLTIFFVFISLLIIYAGILLFDEQKKSIKEQIHSELSEISQYKVDSIISWLKERNRNAELLYENQEFKSLVADILQNPENSFHQNKLLTILKPVYQFHGYRNIYLINDRGNLLYSYPGDIQISGRKMISEALKALTKNEIIYSRFEENPDSGKVFLNYFVPVITKSKSGTVNSAVIILQIDPIANLFPIIQKWPTKSKSAESYVIIRDSNNITFLSRLKFKSKGPSTIYPFGDKNSNQIISYAAAGKSGIFQGIDYKSAQVIADIRNVPNTNWLLVSQVDRDEIYGPVYQISVWYFSVIVFLILIVILSNIIIWKFHKTKTEKIELLSKLEKQALIKHFDYLMKYSGDIFLLLDDKYNVVLANDSAVKTYGYTIDEITGKTIFELHLPENVNELKKHLKEAEITDEMIFEIYHLKNNGQVFPAEDNIRLLKIEGKKFYQKSSRDITERKNYQYKLEKLNRVYAVLSNINQLIVREHDKDQLLDRLCSIAVEDGKFKMVWIGIYDETNQVVNVVAYSGHISNYLDNLEIHMDDPVRNSGPTGKCIKTGIHQISNDIMSDKNMIPWRENAIKNNYKSSAAFPISVFGEIMGVINFYSEELYFFNFEETKLLDELASDISFALEFLEIDKRREFAVASLKKSQERFKDLANLLPQTVFEADQTLKIMFINKAGLLMFGLSDKDLGNGFYLTGLFANHDKSLLLSKLDSLLDNNQPDVNEFTFEDKSGRQFNVIIYVNRIYEYGRPAGYRGLIIDNSLQKKAEAEILRSREQYQSIFEEVLTGNFISKINGELVTCNNAYLKLFEFENLDEALKFNQNLLFISDKEREKLFILLKEKKKIKNYESEMRNKNEEKLYVIENLSGSFDKEGNLVEIKGYIIDITQKKLIEDQIKLQARMLDSVGQAVTSENTKGDIIYWNKSAEILYGLTKDQVLNKNISEIAASVFHDFETSDISYFFLNKEDWSGETLVKNKNGELIPINITNSPFYNSAGELIGTVNIATNLTEQKKKEDELLQAKEKAEEMNRLKSNFLANMSHELRTPMIGILGYSEILSEELEDSEYLDMIKSIRNSGNRLMKTLNFLLDLSRIESKIDEIILQITEVNELIMNVIKNYEGFARTKNLYLKYSFKNEKIQVKLDEKVFAQILDNLINNALKFTKTGGVTVETAIESIDDIPTAVIKIIDTGIGISKKYHEIIFEEFRQVSEGINRGYEGSGLGLTITRKSVELLNGKISVKSEINKGSTFTVMFPAENVTADLSDNKDTHYEDRIDIPVTKSNERILIVDNDTTTLDYIKLILEKYYYFDTASNGNAAIELASKNNYVLVLMDIGLGIGIDGIDTSKEIRKLPGYNSIPIIAVTAYAMKGDRETFLLQGLSDYISKPFQAKELIDIIQNNLMKF